MTGPTNNVRSTSSNATNPINRSEDLDMNVISLTTTTSAMGPSNTKRSHVRAQRTVSGSENTATKIDLSVINPSYSNVTISGESLARLGPPNVWDFVGLKNSSPKGGAPISTKFYDFRPRIHFPWKLGGGAHADESAANGNAATSTVPFRLALPEPSFAPNTVPGNQCRAVVCAGKLSPRINVIQGTGLVRPLVQCTTRTTTTSPDNKRVISRRRSDDRRNSTDRAPRERGNDNSTATPKIGSRQDSRTIDSLDLSGVQIPSLIYQPFQSQQSMQPRTSNVQGPVQNHNVRATAVAITPERRDSTPTSSVNTLNSTASPSSSLSLSSPGVARLKTFSTINPSLAAGRLQFLASVQKLALDGPVAPGPTFASRTSVLYPRVQYHSGVVVRTTTTTTRVGNTAATISSQRTTVAGARENNAPQTTVSHRDPTSTRARGTPVACGPRPEDSRVPNDPRDSLKGLPEGGLLEGGLLDDDIVSDIEAIESSTPRGSPSGKNNAVTAPVVKEESQVASGKKIRLSSDSECSSVETELLSGACRLSPILSAAEVSSATEELLSSAENIARKIALSHRLEDDLGPIRSLLREHRRMSSPAAMVGSLAESAEKYRNLVRNSYPAVNRELPSRELPSSSTSHPRFAILARNHAGRTQNFSKNVATENKNILACRSSNAEDARAVPVPASNASRRPAKITPAPRVLPRDILNDSSLLPPREPSSTRPTLSVSNDVVRMSSGNSRIVLHTLDGKQRVVEVQAAPAEKAGSTSPKASGGDLGVGASKEAIDGRSNLPASKSSTRSNSEPALEENSQGNRDLQLNWGGLLLRTAWDQQQNNVVAEGPSSCYSNSAIVPSTTRASSFSVVRRESSSGLTVRRNSVRSHSSMSSNKTLLLHSSHHRKQHSQNNTLWLGDLPEELLAITCKFLTHPEMFQLCMACNRVVPQMWGVVLVGYSRTLKLTQNRCEAQGILTEIASESQILAQEQWWECTQVRKMMEEDVRRYDANPARFEADLEECIDLERDKLNRFQATVGVLAEVMRMWGECCSQRDQIAKMCQSFHGCVTQVFKLQLAGPRR